MNHLTDAYSELGTESVRMLHLGNSKRVTECNIEIFLFVTRYTNPTRQVDHKNRFSRLETKIIWGHNLIFSIIEKFYYAPGLRVG